MWLFSTSMNIMKMLFSKLLIRFCCCIENIFFAKWTHFCISYLIVWKSFDSPLAFLKSYTPLYYVTKNPVHFSTCLGKNRHNKNTFSGNTEFCSSRPRKIFLKLSQTAPLMVGRSSFLPYSHWSFCLLGQLWIYMSI